MRPGFFKTLIAAAAGVMVDGMRLGMNTTFVTTYTGATYFANLCYQMDAWEPVSPGTVSPYSQEFGYLTATNQTDRFRGKFNDIDGVGLPSGEYTLINPDGIEVGVGAYNNPDAACPFSTATYRTFEFTPSAGMWLHVKGSVTATTGRLAVIIPGHASSWGAGNIWNSAFLDWYASQDVQVVRAMNLRMASNNFETNWSDRTPTTSISFTSPCAWGGSVVPWEFLCDLSSRTGKDVWANLPYRATDSYITQLAGVLAAALPPGNRMWFELGNEVWNFGAAWTDGTKWVSLLNNPKYLAAVNHATDSLTLAGHGMSNGTVLTMFDMKDYTIQYKKLPGQIDWLTVGGINMTVEVVDADTFKIKTSGGTYAVFDVLAQTHVLFAKQDETHSSLRNMNHNYAKRSLEMWDILDAGLGSHKYVKLIAGQVSNPTTISERLGYGATASRAQYAAGAPYFAAYAFGGEATPIDGEIGINWWGNRDANVYAAVYAAGATPSISDVIAGTGAIGHVGPISTTARDSTAYGPEIGRFTGLTVGTSYKVHFVTTGVFDSLWTCSTTVTASTGSPAGYALEAFADTKLRFEANDAADRPMIAAFVAACGAVPFVCYEGGLHWHESAPAAVKQWQLDWMDASEFGEAITHYLKSLSSLSAKLFCWYSDCRPGTFGITRSFYNPALPRNTAFSAFNGFVEKPVQISVPDQVVSQLTEPSSYPHKVADLDPSYIHRIIGGNAQGRFEITGSALYLKSAGFDFGTPATFNIQILATDGDTSDAFTTGVTLGQAWYESDAQFAWSPITDSTVSSLIPVRGSALALTNGVQATVSGGLVDMTGAAYLNSTTGTTATVPLSTPIFVAWTLDRYNQSASAYKRLVQVGGASTSIQIETNANAVTGAKCEIYANSAPGSMNFGASAGLASGLHVYWLYGDGAGNWQAGIDQTNGGTLVKASASNLPRAVAVGRGDTAGTNSQMRHGAMQVVSRTGMTLAQAKAMVQKMMDHHGIT